ncbi:MAG TPA: site-2 protease family protein [Thermoplasmata archaeon]|nr:site-2 protease family protein [Thermoplasmata archaeon]
MNDPYLGYVIALLAVAVYAAIVYALYAAGRLGPDRALTLFGPALMVKTTRGRSALDRWGRFKRFWTVVSDVGVALSVLAMAVILGLLLFGAIASFRISAAQAPSVSEAVGLPGINPFIPIGYGIIALVVGIVLHELSHGVVARSQGIGVKSLGILWCVVPIGAFVEQDDKEMLAATRRKRDRVAAAGVLANFVLAVIFFAVLSLLVAASVQPNANGVGIAYVQGNTPAANATLVPGDIITSINGTQTTTANSFESSLAHSTPGETVTVVYYSSSLGHSVSTNVVLATNPNNKSRGFLGVAVSILTPAELKQTLVWPAGSDQGPLVGTVYWIILPLGGLEPVSGSTTDYYHLSGPLAGVDMGTFWIGANILYWLAWMNLLLGLSNALPLVPLDGGLLFRDFAASVAARFRKGWDEAHLDQFAGRAVTVSSLVVLVLLAWQFIVPRLL